MKFENRANLNFGTQYIAADLDRMYSAIQQLNLDQSKNCERSIRSSNETVHLKVEQ